MNQEEKIQPDYDEVDFMEYVRIIIKRKWLILGLFLIGLMAAGILTSLLTNLSLKTYKVETSFEIGRFGGDSPLEAPSQVIEKIKSGVYGTYPGIETSNPANTNLIKMEIISTNPEGAKKALESINKSILANHNSQIETKKNILEAKIARLQEDINFLIPKNQQIASLKLEIYSLQKQIENFQPTQIIQELVILEEAKKGLSPILNLIIGGILGIFIGMFLAFGKEWWDKNKAMI